MIITRLREYAERENLLEDPAFELRPVRFVIEIDEEGRYLGLREPPGRVEKRGNKEVTLPREMFVPRIGNRPDGKTPCLLADIIPRVLPGYDQKPADRNTHANFVKWVREAAEATGHVACRAVARFLEAADDDPSRLEPLKLALEAVKPRAGDWITFAVAGHGPVLELDAVKAYWRDRYRERQAGKLEDRVTMTCLSCGVPAAVLDTHDKIKGVPGANPSGASLISADKSAFGSYGLDKSQTSPVCRDCEGAYTRGLQHLIDTEGRHYLDRDGGVVFVFWTREPTGDTLSFFDPQPEHVRSLLQSAYRPSQRGVVADGNAFYAAALSGVGGRVMIRDWIETTVPLVQRNLQAWFRDLGIILDRSINMDDKKNVPEGCQAGCIYHAWPLNRLIRAVGQKGSKGYQVPSGASTALFKAAVLGEPLGTDLLAAAIRRVQSEEDPVPPARAALLRLALNRLVRQRCEGGLEMNEALDPAQANAGYRCGRLFAVLSRLQYLALGQTNATIVDRYYGAASTTPSSVFGRLLHLAQAHLSKLGASRPGAATNIRKDIEEITTQPVLLTEFPRQLTLEDQGRFALGFYHQAAEYRRRSSEQGGSEGEEPLPAPTDTQMSIGPDADSE